jgi:hypothetical protein
MVTTIGDALEMFRTQPAWRGKDDVALYAAFHKQQQQQQQQQSNLNDGTNRIRSFALLCRDLTIAKFDLRKIYNFLDPKFKNENFRHPLPN